MAKGNMLLGQARGKVGDIVFSRNNGKQVIKARSEVVKNPQTTAQTLQRILLNTISQSYSGMLSIVDHSFEGVKVGQDTMAQFMKANLNRIRARVTTLKNNTGVLTGFYSVMPVGYKGIAINNYVMSEGTLPRVSVTGLNISESGAEAAQITIAGEPETLTYADIINNYGLRKGDQLTFCELNYKAGEDITFNFCRVILAPQDEEGLAVSLDTPFIVDGAINCPNERNEGGFSRISENAGVISFAIAGGVPVGACVIVSRQAQSGEWQRSSAAMFVTSAPEAYGQWSLLDAIDLFYSGGMDLGSDYYLNNSQSVSQSSSSSTATTPSLGSLYIAGYSALSNSASRTISPNSEASVIANVNNNQTSYNSKLVITKRALNVGDLFDSQSGDIVIAIDGSSKSATVDLSADGVYNIYFVTGGYVSSKHAVFTVETPETAHLTSATFGGTSLLSGATITSITAGTQATLALAATVNGLTTPKVKIVKTDTQPSVGGTISSAVFDQALTDGQYSGSYTFADSGYHYLALCDDNTIIEVASAINVQTASGGGNESAMPGEGD